MDSVYAARLTRRNLWYNKVKTREIKSGLKQYAVCFPEVGFRSLTYEKIITYNFLIVKIFFHVLPIVKT
jgi:hypothetical protein